jgi:hypothetical protein
VAERTGCDLRRFADVVELLIAIRLLGGVPPDAAGRKLRERLTTDVVTGALTLPGPDRSE